MLNIDLKYSKALYEKLDSTSKAFSIDYFQALSDLLKQQNKFSNIINSPFISKQDKQDLILIKEMPTKIENFVKLLIDKDFLYLIHDILRYLKLFIAQEKNTFTAIICTQFSLEQNLLDHIKGQLEDRFNAIFVLQEVIDRSYNGFRLELPQLGYEATFSKERFQEDLINHILKSIKG